MKIEKNYQDFSSRNIITASGNNNYTAYGTGIF